MLLALAFAGVADAQTDLPRVRNAQLGFSGQVRNRHWTPLVVDVENPGPARVGLLVAETEGAFSGQRVQFTRPVILPAQSVRRFEFPILPDIRPSQTSEKTKLERVLTVKLTDGSVRDWSQSDAYGHLISEDSFFLLIADSHLDGYRVLRDGVIGAARRGFARAQLMPKNLPRRPLDLRSFDAVVLGGLEETELSPLQLRALREFVELGGHLVVLPSAANGISPALAEMLPGAFISPQRVETLPAVAGNFIFTNGVTMARLVVERGEVLVGTRERPWIISRGEGAGRVTMLGFNAGHENFTVWPGATDFWRGLLGDAPQFLHHADRLLARSVQVERVLASLAGLKVLSRQGVVWYLAGVAGVLLLVLAAFRFTRAPEWGWAVAASLAVLGGIGVVVGSAKWKSAPQPFLNEVYVSTATSGADAGRVQSALGVFSPAEQAFHFRTAADTASLSPGRSVMKPPELMRIAYEERLAVSNLAVRADDLRTLIGRAPLTSLHAADVRARVSADGVSLVVSNRSDAVLSGAFLKFNRFITPLADVPAHTQIEHAGLRENARSTSTDLLRSARQEQRERLREVFFPTPQYAGDLAVKGDDRRFTRLLRGREPVPVLFSWSDEPAFPLASLDPVVSRRAVGLLAVAGGVDYSGPTLLLPSGVMPLHLRNLSAHPFERGEGCFAGGRPALLAVEFSLPAGCPELTAQELTIHFGFRGTAFEPQVFVAPGNFSLPDTLARLPTGMEKLSGTSPLRVPQPERFLHAGLHSVLVVVRLDYSAAGKRIGSQMNPNIHTWQVRDLDLELKGTTP